MLKCVITSAKYEFCNIEGCNADNANKTICVNQCNQWTISYIPPLCFVSFLIINLCKLELLGHEVDNHFCIYSSSK